MILILLTACVKGSGGGRRGKVASRVAAACPADFDLRGLGMSRVKCYGSFLFDKRRYPAMSATDPSSQSSKVHSGTKGSSIALCLFGKHGPEGSFSIDTFRSFVAHVTSVLTADLFVTPGPFSARRNIQDVMRREAGKTDIYFDENDYFTFEGIVSALAMNATRWPWAFREDICRHVEVDNVTRCLATALNYFKPAT